MESNPTWFMSPQVNTAAPLHAVPSSTPYYYTTASVSPAATPMHHPQHSVAAQPTALPPHHQQPFYVLQAPNGTQSIVQTTSSPPQFMWVQQQQQQPAPQPTYYIPNHQQPQPLYVMSSPAPSSSMQSHGGAHLPTHMSHMGGPFVIQGPGANGSLDSGHLLPTPNSMHQALQHQQQQSPQHMQQQQRKSMMSSMLSAAGNSTSNATQLPLTHESEQPDPNVIHSIRPFLGPKSTIGSILETPSKLPLLDTLPPLARRRPPPIQPPPASREAI